MGQLFLSAICSIRGARSHLRRMPSAFRSDLSLWRVLVGRRQAVVRFVDVLVTVFLAALCAS
eukprot:JP444439.1.p3 GENE.JP444439.1~~JP444439.1.p3  ORF type:complete len:62 (-),score=3.92 JP444439.1:53-238(-)